MSNVFENAILGHVSGKPFSHKAVQEWLPTEDFVTAIEEITQWEGYTATPLFNLQELAASLALDKLMYKDEGPRFGLGSFKALGGSYAALRVLQRQISNLLDRKVSLRDIRLGKYSREAAEITMVSATDGNHGRSLAWGCQRFGVPCKIYIHAKVSEERASAMKNFGAEVIRINGTYDDSVEFARIEADKNKWIVVSDTSWPGYFEPPRDVMLGYGVLTSEINEKLTLAPTHIFLQSACGGFAASVASALRHFWGDQTPRVVIVESELAACLFECAKANKLTSVRIEEETIMAGLSCGEPSDMAWGVLSEEASDFITIPDKIVPPTVRLLALPKGNAPVIKAGESAVAGLAVLVCASKQPGLREKLGLDKNSRVLLIGTEGVTDAEIFARIMEGEMYG
jgi:diaminopropionate ammonia-lyase